MDKPTRDLIRTVSGGDSSSFDGTGKPPEAADGVTSLFSSDEMHRRHEINTMRQQVTEVRSDLAEIKEVLKQIYASMQQCKTEDGNDTP